MSMPLQHLSGILEFLIQQWALPNVPSLIPQRALHNVTSLIPQSTLPNAPYITPSDVPGTYLCILTYDQSQKNKDPQNVFQIILCMRKSPYAMNDNRFPYCYRTIVIVQPTPCRHNSSNYPIVRGPLRNHSALKKASSISRENCRHDL